MILIQILISNFNILNMIKIDIQQLTCNKYLDLTLFLKKQNYFILFIQVLPMRDGKVAEELDL